MYSVFQNLTHFGKLPVVQTLDEERIPHCKLPIHSKGKIKAIVSGASKICRAAWKHSTQRFFCTEESHGKTKAHQGTAITKRAVDKTQTGPGVTVALSTLYHFQHIRHLQEVPVMLSIQKKAMSSSSSVAFPATATDSYPDRTLK